MLLNCMNRSMAISISLAIQNPESRCLHFFRGLKQFEEHSMLLLCPLLSEHQKKNHVK